MQETSSSTLNSDGAQICTLSNKADAGLECRGLGGRAGDWPYCDSALHPMHSKRFEGENSGAGQSSHKVNDDKNTESNEDNEVAKIADSTSVAEEYC